MKNTGLLLVILGLILLVLALVYGFNFDEKVLIAEGDVYEYQVTYTEEQSVVDSSVYTMEVGDKAEIAGGECYFIELDIVNEDAAKNGAARTAMSAYGPVNTSVLSGDMWVLADTLDLAQKAPVSIVGGFQVSTTLIYTYEGEHGYPWEVGKEWTYTINVSSTSGQSWDIAMTAGITEIEDIMVPAGTFRCYRIEHKAVGADDPGLIEWYSEELGVFVMMTDYSNYVGVETRELASYSLER